MLIEIIIITAVVLFLVFAISKNKTAKKFFTCHDCKGQFRHNPRTLDIAARYKYPKIYCPECFQNHSELHVKKKFEPYDKAPTKGGGCLGFIAIIVLLPLLFSSFNF